MRSEPPKGGAGLGSIIVVNGTMMVDTVADAVRHRILAGRSAPFDLDDPVQLEVFD